MISFKEKYGPWALVTGASAGIGAEFARQLSNHGLNLILLARRKDRLDALANELQAKHNVEVKTLAVDLAQRDFMSAIQPAIQNLEIGLLVNNAGFGIVGSFLQSDLARELEMLDVNCRAPIMLTHELGKTMVKRKKGGIIIVSSTASFLPIPYMTHYAATKAFDLSLGEGLWYELKEHGVDVLALCPGGTSTEFHQVAGLKEVMAMSAETVVRQALKGLGKKASLVNGWQNRLKVFLVRLNLRWINASVAGNVLKRLKKL
ncbi:MAG: SDR family NAD(P)-dependent oxidoreductase [Deltaproteobacteria bacterium]|nr:SDR family NAD(P)-dependent oxidoreductase [Deltaproteobacteria bacterium]